MSTEPQPAKPPATRRQRRLKKLLAWVLGIGLFLLVLPEIIRFALIQFLPDTGIGDVEIADIDLNLFALTAGVDGLEISREGDSKLSLDKLAADVSWLKLLVGEFHLQNIVIDGLRMPVTQGDDGIWEAVIPLAGSGADTTQPEQEPPADKGLQLPKVLVQSMDVRNVAVTIDSQLISGTAAIDELVLTEASSWLLEPATLTLKARWNDAPIGLQLSATPWVEVPEASGQVSVDDYPLGSLSTALGLPLSGQLNLKMDFSLRQTPEGIFASVPVTLGVRSLAAEYKTLDLKQAALDWQGEVKVGLHPGTDEAISYSVAGDLKSEGLSIRDTQQQVVLLQWQQFGIDKLSLDQALNLQFARLGFEALDSIDVEQESGRLYTGSVTLTEGKLVAGNRFHLASVELLGGEYDVEINKEGRLRAEGIVTTLLNSLAEPAESAPGPEAAGKAPETPPQGSEPFIFGIDRLRVADNTRISLLDRRFSPPVRQDLFIRELLVEHLDQAQPGQATAVSLVSNIGEFGSLNVSGTVKPFAEPLAVALEGEIKAVELPGLSPYSEAYIGYHLSRGQYDHKFKVDIADEQINLKNTLVLRQLAIESVDPDKPQPIEQQLDVPLGLALDMLRDDKDNIELKVPIKGRMDDPDININSVINKALAKAVKNGATSYLKYALQPYGAVLMAADFVGGQISAVRLEPVPFEPGSDALPEQTDYLDKLEKLLADRPALQLTLCGRANEADQQVLLAEAGDPKADVSEALLGLADKRAKNLKRLFIEKGVESSRLLLCQARFEPGAVSGVQMEM